MQKGDAVIDLGAAPGGWSQVAKELVGEDGTVIGIDLLRIEPINGVTFLQGDLTKEPTLQKIMQISEGDKADILLSDMSPNISGNYSIDQARSMYLCEQALKATENLLKDGGHFVCKLFAGEDTENFIQEVHQKFKAVKCYSPPASRKSSSEVYIVARYFHKSHG